VLPVVGIECNCLKVSDLHDDGYFGCVEAYEFELVDEKEQVECRETETVRAPKGSKIHTYI
jgi:hypothetical protein